MSNEQRLSLWLDFNGYGFTCDVKLSGYIISIVFSNYNKLSNDRQAYRELTKFAPRIFENEVVGRFLAIAFSNYRVSNGHVYVTCIILMGEECSNEWDFQMKRNRIDRCRNGYTAYREKCIQCVTRPNFLHTRDLLRKCEFSFSFSLNELQ